MACSMCPGTMCPLFAKEGSPWTGDKASPCPQRRADLGGCGWWGGFGAKGCGGVLAAEEQIAEASEGRFVLQIGAVRADQSKRRPSKHYDCPQAADCQWQREAGENLCPPRQALKLGLDPKIAAY